MHFSILLIYSNCLYTVTQIVLIDLAHRPCRTFRPGTVISNKLIALVSILFLSCFRHICVRPLLKPFLFKHVIIFFYLLKNFCSPTYILKFGTILKLWKLQIKRILYWHFFFLPFTSICFLILEKIFSVWWAIS